MVLVQIAEQQQKWDSKHEYPKGIACMHWIIVQTGANACGHMGARRRSCRAPAEVPKFRPQKNSPLCLRAQECELHHLVILAQLFQEHRKRRKTPKKHRIFKTSAEQRTNASLMRVWTDEGTHVTSTADIIACAVSISSHSAAARRACQISDLPTKAGAVSQNSSRLDSSCPFVIGLSEFHTGACRQICLFPGPGATVAQTHTHTTHTFATNSRQQDVGGRVWRAGAE